MHQQFYKQRNHRLGDNLRSQLLHLGNFSKYFGMFRPKTQSILLCLIMESIAGPEVKMESVAYLNCIFRSQYQWSKLSVVDLKSLRMDEV